MNMSDLARSSLKSKTVSSARFVCDSKREAKAALVARLLLRSEQRSMPLRQTRCVITESISRSRVARWSFLADPTPPTAQRANSEIGLHSQPPTEAGGGRATPTTPRFYTQ